MTEVAGGSNRWRFAEGGNAPERNYPPGKECEDCGGGMVCARECGVLR